MRAADAQWHALRQEVALQPYADYQVTMWLRTSAAFTGGFAGLRTVQPPGESCAPCSSGSCPNGAATCWPRLPSTADRTPIKELTYGAMPQYQELTFTVNAGASSLAEVYVGFKGSGPDQWVQIDDVSVRPLQRLRNGGFETAASSAIGGPWASEGTGAKGIDRAAGYARSGENNGWIRTSHANEWNALTQVVSVHPSTWYSVRGYVQTSTNLANGYFGARGANDAILGEQKFGASASYAPVGVWIYTGANTTITVYGGFWSNGQDAWMRLDDVGVE